MYRWDINLGNESEMKRLLSLALSLMLFLSVFGQRVDDARQSSFDQVIEMVSENLEAEELDFTTFLEDLNDLYDHPINLNRARREDLRKLRFLSEFQIEALIQHRASTGNILSLYELQGIEGFDLYTIEGLVPFVKVSGSLETHQISWNELKREGSHTAFVRYQQIVEPMEGFLPIEDSVLQENPNRRYVGSKPRVYARYRYRYLDNISFGVTMEKDAGEEFFGSTQPKGFDYYSAHFYIGNRGILKQAIIGDYQAQFGQGLTFWTGLAFGKSLELGSVKRNAREITPYTSADENNFMRGAAATLEFGPVQVTSFFSYKNVDANISALDTNDIEIRATEFSSFQSSGIHGTRAQLEDKDAISEMNTGAHVRFIQDNIQIGMTGVYTKYGAEQGVNTSLYRQFEPVSNEFLVFGFDYQFNYRNLLGFGESSLRYDGANAWLNGAILSLNRSLDLSLLHRDFSPSYFSPRSNAFGEGSRATNEKGLFFGMDAKFGLRWRLKAYYDLFQFDWLRYQVDAPSTGKELSTQLEYKPSRRTQFYVRYRIEDKARNTTLPEKNTTQIGVRSRQWFRLNSQFTLNKTLSFRNRLEVVLVDQPNGENERGWMMYQDVVWKPMWPAKYQVKVRYAIFDTDSYDSRIYAYEHDVLYSFSIPAYYYRGSRAYLILGYDLTKWSDLTLRLSQTYFANRDVVGSGLNEIDGSTRTEIKLQYRLKF